MTQASPSIARATRSLKRSSGTSVQFGPHASASSSTKETPSRRARSRPNVVLPEPVEPTTEIRRGEPSGETGRGRPLGLLYLLDGVVLTLTFPLDFSDRRLSERFGDAIGQLLIRWGARLIGCPWRGYRHLNDHYETVKRHVPPPLAPVGARNTEYSSGSQVGYLAAPKLAPCRRNGRS